MAFFSSNFEPTSVCLGELRSRETPLAQCDNHLSAEVLCAGVAKLRQSAQDMGQLAASLLVECIEGQSQSKREDDSSQVRQHATLPPLQVEMISN
jgi:hypothetical protein